MSKASLVEPLLSYEKFTSSSPHTEPPICPCCQEEILKGQEAVSHGGPGGDLHPLHKICARSWAEVDRRCPVCRCLVGTQPLFPMNIFPDQVTVLLPVEERPLVPLRERVVAELRSVGKDLFGGAAAAAVVGSVATGIVFGSGLLVVAVDGRVTLAALRQRADISLLAGLPIGSGLGVAFRLLASESLPEWTSRSKKLAISIARAAAPALVATSSLMLVQTMSLFDGLYYPPMMASFAAGAVVTCLQGFFERRMVNRLHG